MNVSKIIQGQDKKQRKTLIGHKYKESVSLYIYNVTIGDFSQIMRYRAVSLQQPNFFSNEVSLLY